MLSVFVDSYCGKVLEILKNVWQAYLIGSEVPTLLVEILPVINSIIRGTDVLKFNDLTF